ncbi:hypothetical protein LJC05_01865 [Bacteroides sp. OttesenSCG-928-J23]|nr:hypothetical protein [Bacteroides sp. OttesenSCG-928-J23]
MKRIMHITNRLNSGPRCGQPSGRLFSCQPSGRLSCQASGYLSCQASGRLSPANPPA